jgi:hypothetical protein
MERRRECPSAKFQSDGAHSQQCGMALHTSRLRLMCWGLDEPHTCPRRRNRQCPRRFRSGRLRRVRRRILTGADSRDLGLFWAELFAPRTRGHRAANWLSFHTAATCHRRLRASEARSFCPRGTMEEKQLVIPYRAARLTKRPLPSGAGRTASSRGQQPRSRNSG